MRVLHASCQGEPLRSSPVDPLPHGACLGDPAFRCNSKAITSRHVPHDGLQILSNSAAHKATRTGRHDLIRDRFLLRPARAANWFPLRLTALVTDIAGQSLAKGVSVPLHPLAGRKTRPLPSMHHPMRKRGAVSSRLIGTCPLPSEPHGKRSSRSNTDQQNSRRRCAL